MNYLAHFHLSFQHPDLVLGNLAGDVVKANDWQNFPEGIACGIRLHRFIDSFTDSHPDTLALVRLLRPFSGRFSGPVSDILRDHLLSNNWTQFSRQSLDQFSQEIYLILDARWQELPATLHLRVQKMVEHRWLSSYQTLGGLEFVFHKFAPRLPSNTLKINELMSFIEENQSTLSAEFSIFYAAMQQHAFDFALKNLPQYFSISK